MTKVMLTVDWDYFLDEHGHFFDWGHGEKPIMLEMAWYSRAADLRTQGIDIRDVLSLNGKQVGFWQRLRQRFNIKENVPIHISDSHEEAHKVALQYKVDTVYSFDQHTDLGYTRANERAELDCGNWLGKLLYDGDVRKARVILPDTGGDREVMRVFKEIMAGGIPAALENAAKIGASYRWDKLAAQCDLRFPTEDALLAEKSSKIPVACIVICRSGGWTPPYMDGDFLSFCREIWPDLELPLRNWDWDHVEERATILADMLKEFQERMAGEEGVTFKQVAEERGYSLIGIPTGPKTEEGDK